MRTITISCAAVLAFALTSPFAFAHKHAGWGCHAHQDEPDEKWVDGFKRIHCGNGSR